MECYSTQCKANITRYMSTRFSEMNAERDLYSAGQEITCSMRTEFFMTITVKDTPLWNVTPHV